MGSKAGTPEPGSLSLTLNLSHSCECPAQPSPLWFSGERRILPFNGDSVCQLPCPSGAWPS